jgi:hypothetical protein
VVRAGFILIETYRIVRGIESNLFGSQIQTLRELTESDLSRGFARKQDSRILCICAQDDFTSAFVLGLNTDLTEKLAPVVAVRESVLACIYSQFWVRG